jgi:hypothetical protein
MPASKSFDFENYLKALDPEQTYHIEELIGGVCNVVVRAIKREPSEKSRFLSYNSLILKHAKPYFLMRGPDTPMSLVRQVRDHLKVYKITCF